MEIDSSWFGGVEEEDKAMILLVKDGFLVENLYRIGGFDVFNLQQPMFVGTLLMSYPTEKEEKLSIWD